MKSVKIFFFISLIFISINLIAEKITFPSIDGIRITAEYYNIHPDTVPIILLFHQAGWSRGEYIEIAPRLNRIGYNCLAVDLRSGNTVNNIQNETFLEAKRMMKETNYLAAEIDMKATIEFVRKTYPGEVILWGSSYSASLVIKIAVETDVPIKAIIAFSPGEYFRSFGKPADFIKSYATRLNVPSFIACSEMEGKTVKPIYDSIINGNKVFCLPKSSGHHGSSALWNIHFDSKFYWNKVEDFLSHLN